MKITVSREVYSCDVCSKENGYKIACISCDKEFCYDCEKKECVELRFLVWGQGSRDIILCLACNLTPKKHLELINSYRKIMALRNENTAFYDSFKKRSEDAEKEAERLYDLSKIK